ncbi:MAG: OmpA family protein [Kaiparowitsia implicata GSE-PSE-MK54-09C]|jgi:OOP family OmpA-OmpF porin|nr:OmpA family protein [Kaiparowitsia implicata GSE-PSE-MK54-09C]
MELKNTLGVVIGALAAVSSFGVLAQGQNAFEVDVFGKRAFTESNRDATDGNLFGGSVGYYLTDDVSLNLSHGVYKSIRSNDTLPGSTHGREKIDGHLSTLEAVYHFGTPEAKSFRPYVSAGFGHQNLDNTYGRGNDETTFAIVGAGAKYYFSEMFFAKAGVDVLHSLDTENTEWQAGVGVGVNFGGSSKPNAPVTAAYQPEPTAETVQTQEATEVVRVELDVKFDFDKANVKPESYADIKALADFMSQYPSTTTVVEGHTDSRGGEAYNQNLSERRAIAVREVLVNQYGVDAARVSAAGYGESRPVAENATHSGRAINRRVEAEVETQVKP